jgi:hypothetical protein
MDQEVPNEGVQCIALHRKGVINKFDAKKKNQKKNPNKGGRPTSVDPTIRTVISVLLGIVSLNILAERGHM